MSGRSLTALIAAALLAGAPATALAGGGAGDQEYQDPLTAPSTPQAKKPAQQTTPAAAAPAASSQSSPAAAGSQSGSAPASAGASAATLPRTGAPAGLVAAIGAALAGAGLALRRRTAHG